MLCREMMCYDIYLLQFGFHAVQCWVNLGKNSEETAVYKEIQKHIIRKYKTNFQSKKTNIKKLLCRISRVIKK